MKKTFILAALSVLLTSVYAISPASAPTTPLKASSIKIPLGDSGQEITLEQLAHIKPKEYAKLTGRHMNIFQRAGFSIAQQKLRNEINPDGTLSGKKYQKLAASMDRETGFHIGGFALGFLLGLIGVLIAYLINDDYRSNRRKWAWIGFGAFLIIYVVIILASA